MERLWRLRLGQVALAVLLACRPAVIVVCLNVFVAQICVICVIPMSICHVPMDNSDGVDGHVNMLTKNGPYRHHTMLPSCGLIP